MQPVREVYSLLMPVQDGRIIVPRAAVAEVMGYTQPKERPDDAPAFVLGFIDWQGQKIPLVSFEAARGRDVPELGRRTRIAIVFGIANRLQPNVFAVVTQGYPYLVRVNENVLQREQMEANDPLVLARVRMANEKPYIPNLEKLELLIADALGVAPASEEVEPEPVDELAALAAGEDDEEFDAGLGEIDVGEFEAGETGFDSGEADSNGSGLDAGESAEIDLGEVTEFGTNTNYSEELDELSAALGDASAEDEKSEVSEDQGFAVDLSGFEVEEEGSGGEDTSSGETDAADDAGEIDFSDLDVDFDDDEKKD